MKEGKIPLLINLDESPMPLVYGNACGNIKIQRGPGAVEPRRKATRNEQRIHFTFIAMICNVAWIQPYLPQVLIVPKRCLPVREWRIIAGELPENVYLLRQGSMWVSSKLHKIILRLLRKCLHRLRIQRLYHVILLADAFGGHITIESMAAMKDYGFYFVLLPAGLTWLMQPLDVETFVRVKRFLRARFGTVPETNAPTRIVLRALQDCVAAIMTYFVDKSWAHVFDSLGLNGAEPPTGKHLHRELGWLNFPPIPRERPTEAMIRINTPGNRLLHSEALKGCMPQVDSAPPSHPPAAPAAPSLAVTPSNSTDRLAPARRELPQTFTASAGHARHT